MSEGSSRNSWRADGKEVVMKTSAHSINFVERIAALVGAQC